MNCVQKVNRDVAKWVGGMNWQWFMSELFPMLMFFATVVSLISAGILLAPNEYEFAAFIISIVFGICIGLYVMAICIECAKKGEE